MKNPDWQPEMLPILHSKECEVIASYMRTIVKYCVVHCHGYMLHLHIKFMGNSDNSL